MRQLSFQSFSDVKFNKWLVLILALAFALRVFYNYALNTLTSKVIVLDLLVLALITLVYICAFQISKNDVASLLSASIVALMPFAFESWREAGAAIFLLVALFGLLKFKERIGLGLLIAGSVISALLHYSALFIVPTFALYLLLIGLEDRKYDFDEIKYFALACILAGFIVLLITKLPRLIDIETILSLNGVFRLIGTRPILFGVLGAYFGLVHKNKSSLIFLSLVVAAFGLLLFNYIGTNTGLTYLILGLAVLACFNLKETLTTLNNSRFKQFKDLAIAAWFAIIMIFGLWLWILNLLRAV